MSSYKVPQDVEADDKILGPFSFRQFIYLIIVTLAGLMSWGLAQIFVPLAVIPFPIIIFFGALALPLRKDQPMEIFLAAMVSFYLKPHKRLWDPDGVESLIEITAPKTIEPKRTKDLSQDEAKSRLSYLANIVDTGGWAIHNDGAQTPNSSMTTDAYFEAQNTQDILADDTNVALTFETKLEKSDTDRHQAMTDLISKAQAAATAAPEKDIDIDFNPYPAFQQSVIQPLDESEVLQDALPNKPAAKPINTSENTQSTAIMDLATSDLPISTIQKQANRIHDKQEMESGVVISWR